MSVNGKEIIEMHIEELANLLRGYPNTKVTITMERPSEKRKRTYNLTREIILIDTVEYKALDNHIGYLKINSFSKKNKDKSEPIDRNVYAERSIFTHFLDFLRRSLLFSQFSRIVFRIVLSKL